MSGASRLEQLAPGAGTPEASVMRALRWHGRGDVRLDQIPRPEPGPGEVLVAVECCGICGTDLEEHRNGPVGIPVDAPHPLTGRTAPMTLGHEIVGRVAASGGGEGPPVGSRVVPDVVLGCGICWWCRRHEEGLCERGAVIGLHADGGLADYVISPAATCVTVPAGLPAAVAVFAEPASVAVRALRKAGDLAGASVVVNGGGTIGLLCAQVARAWGAGPVVVIDPLPARRELALEMGADAAIEPEEALRGVAGLRGGPGARFVIECSGAPGALAAAVGLLGRGGLAVIVGFRDGSEEIRLVDVVLSEKHLVGSAAHLWDEEVTAAVSMLAAGTIDPRPLPVAWVPLEAAVGEAFGAGRPAGGRKVVVTLTAGSGRPTPGAGGGAGRP